MKSVLILICILLLCTLSASAQTGAICVFSDLGGTQCDFVDAGGLVQVHFIHQYSGGATESQFRIDLGGLPWTWLGDIWNFGDAIGGSITGVRIKYGSCLSSPIFLGSANFFGSVAPPGSMIRIAPDPDIGYLRAVDCSNNEFIVAGGKAYVNSALPCECSTTPDPDPLLYVNPLTVDLGETDNVGSFVVANAGGGTLTWNVSEMITWLDVSPAAGTNSGTVTVTVDRTGILPGNHSGQIDVTSNGGNETVTVTLTVPVQDPVLSVSPVSLVFGESGTIRTLSISNIGTGSLSWNIQSDQLWLTANPPIGHNDADVTVTVDRTGLAPGPYAGNLLVSSDGGDIWVPLTMDVAVPIPVLAVSPVSLSFGTSVIDLFLNLYNTGNGDLNWNITTDQSWLSATPASGINSDQVTVSVDRTGLADGAHTGNVFVTSAGGNATVPVDMWVGLLPVLSVDPLVLIFTPADTTHTFAIANTGAGSLEWLLSADKTWIDIVPPLAGTGDATVSVNVDPTLVPSSGIQTGFVTVNSNVGARQVEIRFVPVINELAGSIYVFSDEDGNSCNFVDNGSLVKVYVFHNNTNGATASQFRLDLMGLPWTHLGDIWQVATSIGTSISGVSLGYGACLTSPILLGTINFYGSVAPLCSRIRIVADPAAPTGQIEVASCAANKLIASGGYGRVNPDATCYCGTIAVKECTWGYIKALYRKD
jgi:hypothetical protein